MAVTFQIYPKLGLVYVRYSGIVRASETLSSVQSYAAHPDFRPGQKHLIDTTEVVEMVPDYSEILELQARMVDMFLKGVEELLVGFIAPHAVGRVMAELVANSWSGTEIVKVRVFDTMEQVTDFLGIKPADMMATRAT